MSVSQGEKSTESKNNEKRLDESYEFVVLYSSDELGLFFMPKFLQTNNHGGDVMRTKITLECTECKQRNYNLTKDKKNHPDRMETKKYCRFCRTHTLHKETK